MESKNNNFITIALVVVLIGAAFYIGSLTSKVKQYEGGIPADGMVDDSGQPVFEELAEITDADHVKGNREGRFALIEYSDFECPFCQQFHDTGIQLIENYGDQFMWVYRHFPWDAAHPNARPSAIASECVAKLGGNDSFWSYTDFLYSTTSFAKASLVEEAVKLGIDEGEFTSCLNDSAMNDLVEEDIDSGIKAGVTGTPGAFILDIEAGEIIQTLPGYVPFDDLKPYIDSIIE